MRLARRIVDGRAPGCHYGGKNDVYRCADTGNVKINGCAAKPAGTGDYVVAAVFDGHDRTESLKALLVLIYRARAEIAAARKTDLCLAEATKLGAEKVC